MSEPEKEVSHEHVSDMMYEEASVVSMDTSPSPPERHGNSACSCGVIILVIIIVIRNIIILLLLENIEPTMVEFDRRFIELSSKTKDELRQKSVESNLVYTLMKTISKRDFHSYVLKMRGRPSENFDELFNDLNTFRWNCFEYELLEAIIVRNNCSIALRREMEQHAHNVQEFKRHTVISKLIKHKQYFRNRKFPSKGCKRLRTRHHINPKKSKISSVIDCFQQEVNTKARSYAIP